MLFFSWLCPAPFPPVSKPSGGRFLRKGPFLLLKAFIWLTLTHPDSIAFLFFTFVILCYLVMGVKFHIHRSCPCLRGGGYTKIHFYNSKWKFWEPSSEFCLLESLNSIFCFLALLGKMAEARGRKPRLSPDCHWPTDTLDKSFTLLGTRFLLHFYSGGNIFKAHYYRFLCRKEG